MSTGSVEFERACFAAREASRELDEAHQWEYFDPERLALAQRKARLAFDALVVATREAMT